MIKGVDHNKNDTKNALEEIIDIMDQASHLELDLELETMRDSVEEMTNQEPETHQIEEAKEIKKAEETIQNNALMDDINEDENMANENTIKPETQENGLNGTDISARMDRAYGP
jgi:hypothetical protein